MLHLEAGEAIMKLKFIADEGWYTIVRAEHDGREWWEQIGENSFAFYTSERLTPEACIEGSLEEMIEVATAITLRTSVRFERVAVLWDEGKNVFWFYSPKNSEHLVAITPEEADDLATQIVSYLKENYEQ
jgi:NTP pyrophosphatase (non-canonical NTP hydrolase)